MLSLRLPKELEARLDTLVEHTGRTKTYYVKKALEKFIEDQEDYLLAVAALEEGGENIPFEEVKRLVYGLDNRVQTKSKGAVAKTSKISADSNSKETRKNREAPRP
jgi:RHH-type rel operon transcriptional repressor/antitoxin RelB